MKSFAVVFTYQKGDDTSVYLFDTEEEAVRFASDNLTVMFNDRSDGRKACAIHQNDNMWRSKLEIAYEDRTEFVDVRIGRVYE